MLDRVNMSMRRRYLVAVVMSLAVILTGLNLIVIAGQAMSAVEAEKTLARYNTGSFADKMNILSPSAPPKHEIPSPSMVIDEMLSGDKNGLIPPGFMAAFAFLFSIIGLGIVVTSSAMVKIITEVQVDATGAVITVLPNSEAQRYQAKTENEQVTPEESAKTDLAAAG